MSYPGTDDLGFNLDSQVYRNDYSYFLTKEERNAVKAAFIAEKRYMESMHGLVHLSFFEKIGKKVVGH